MEYEKYPLPELPFDPEELNSDREHDDEFWVRAAEALAADSRRQPTAAQREAFQARLEKEFLKRRMEREAGLSGEAADTEAPEQEDRDRGAERLLAERLSADPLFSDALSAEPSGCADGGQSCVKQTGRGQRYGAEDCEKMSNGAQGCGGQSLAHRGQQTLIHALEKEISHRKIVRRLSRVAVAAVFFVVVGLTLGSPDNAFAAGVSNFFIQIRPQADQVRLTEKIDEDIELNLEDFAGMYIPTGISGNYSLIEAMVEGDVRRLVYEAEDGHEINYRIHCGNDSVNIDNEGTVQKQVFIHDCMGKIIVKESMVGLFWEDGENAYYVYGDLEAEDEIIRFVEKMEIVPEEE